jgi:signal transduction histidine kinase
LLRLAEIETGRHPSAMATLSLRPLIEDVADTMDPVIADRGGTLEVGRLDDVSITGDSDLINQLLINLLENVATHTPAGTRARLSLERDADGAVITIRDDGPGLAAADLVRVTRPFERGASASAARGSGLGLAIAQAIVRFHHGRIDLADAAPGLEVRVRIPANDSPGPLADAGAAAA